MVEQSSDVMHEKRVEKLCNLLLVREVQRALKWDPVRVSALKALQPKSDLPDTFEVHWSYLHDVARLLAFQDTIATPTRHARDVEQLRAVYHVVILPPCYTNTVRLNLEAQATLIFPQCGCHPRLHAMRRNLPTGVEGLLKLLGAIRCWLRV